MDEITYRCHLSNSNVLPECKEDVDRMKAAQTKRVAPPPRKSDSATRVHVKYFLAFEEKENAKAADSKKQVYFTNMSLVWLRNETHICC